LIAKRVDQAVNTDVGGVGAVSVPGDIGPMLMRTMTLGPVLERPQRKRWTVLTGPGRVSDATAQELGRLNVFVAEDGNTVILPGEHDNEHSWVIHPGDGSLPLPSVALVVAKIRSLWRGRRSQA
jgi:hypothetical protein